MYRFHTNFKIFIVLPYRKKHHIYKVGKILFVASDSYVIIPLHTSYHHIWIQVSVT